MRQILQILLAASEYPPRAFSATYARPGGLIKLQQQMGDWDRLQDWDQPGVGAGARVAAGTGAGGPD